MNTSLNQRRFKIVLKLPVGLRYKTYRGHATHRLSKLLMLNRICSRNNSFYFCKKILEQTNQINRADNWRSSIGDKRRPVVGFNLK
ncbi:hypothetical protein P5673_003775 [Acropora cervicornis]|uniref:Uncharacterized protein n=1 Tax=Acropora cervicornis TaxID=6130 RepID=A0AAD9R164_ACRCE|nr:hypothetical protein P5673_003775 [Acropora cervicornis]